MLDMKYKQKYAMNCAEDSKCIDIRSGNVIHRAVSISILIISILGLTGVAGAVSYSNSSSTDISIDELVSHAKESLDKAEANGNNGNELNQYELFYKATSALKESEAIEVLQKPASEITVFVLDDFAGERWARGQVAYILVQQDIVHPSLYDLKYNIIKKNIAKPEGQNEVHDKEKYFNALIEGLKYTVNNPDKRVIISVPWYYGDLLTVSEDETFLAHALIKQLTKKGAIVVVAAGNGDNVINKNRYPATCPAPAGLSRPGPASSTPSGSNAHGRRCCLRRGETPPGSGRSFPGPSSYRALRRGRRSR